MKNIVEVKNLSKRYGRFSALSNISLSIPKGKIVGLIGPNGAGKTSFLKILSGLMLGTSGEVKIDGVSLSAEPELAKQKVALMLENNPLPDHMRVGEYLRFRAALKGIKDIRKSTEIIMRKCDLYYDARYKMIKTLSKGYRQRVGIADALLGDQPLIILDEPTIGLDPRQIILMRKTLLELCALRTLIISSHILAELETICDYYVMINNGEIITSGTWEEITKSNIDNTEYYADVALVDPKEDICRFLDEHGLKYRIKTDNTKEIYHIIFEVKNNTEQGILHALIDHFKDHLISMGKESYSLEDIFLYATKRARDNDLDKFS